jgi:hypothetical protein
MSYEVFALKYAERDARRPDHFVGGDPHDVPMAMDYFVWLIRDRERLVLVDTGFDAAMAEKRGRRLVRTPREALALLGVSAADVKDVVITHLHNDHVGTFFDFPNARFHLQDSEMAYATGRCMTHERLRRAYGADHIAGMVRLVFDDRVVFHDGDEEIAPGVNWFAIMAPAKTPKPVVDKLFTAITQAATAPEMKGQLQAQGVEAFVQSSPDAFMNFLRNELGRWAKIAKQSGARAD